MNVGGQLAHYRITAKLGEGGMGEVYSAEDTKLGRAVALKVLPRELVDDPGRRERLEREARAAAALNHPNICTIHEIGEHDGRPFIAMELLQGEELAHRVARGALPLDDLLSIGVQIADALDAAHEHSIVHRDLKPSNILITSRGHAKVLDFGLAKQAGTEIEADADAATKLAAGLTSPGTAVGTVAYMSPEQVRGQAVDGRSDLFSFGVVLYEMATGLQAFTGNTSGVVFDGILNRPPTSPVRINPDVPDGLERILVKLLEKDPNLRYQTAADLRSDLVRLQRDVASGESSSRVVATPLAAPALAAPPVAGAIPDSASTPAPPGAGVATAPPAPTDAGARDSSSDAAIAIELAQRNKTKLVAAIVGIVVVAMALWWGPALLPSPPSETIDSIVVLPFETAAGDDSAYLGDGIPVALINGLAEVGNLRVIGRASAFRYKGEPFDPQRLRNDLAVRVALTGVLTRRGDNLELAVDLVDLQDSRSLWGEQFDLPAGGLLDVEGQIVRAVASELGYELSAAESAAVAEYGTDSDPAHREYLKGIGFLDRRNKQGFELAIEAFENAIEYDESYALAWSGLADTYHLQASWNYVDSTDARPRALDAAEKALALDPDLAEAHISLASIQHSLLWDMEAAEAEYLIGLRLDPGYASGWQWYGEMLHMLGRYPEALDAIRKAVELEPIAPIHQAVLSLSYYLSGDAETALETAQTLAREHPTFGGAHLYLGMIHSAMGRYEEALADFESYGREPAMVAATLARLGRTEEAREMLAARVAEVGNPDVDPPELVSIAAAYGALGEPDAAFRVLQQAYEDRDIATVLMATDGILMAKELHADERYAELLELIGFPRSVLDVER